MPFPTTKPQIPTTQISSGRGKIVLSWYRVLGCIRLLGEQKTGNVLPVNTKLMVNWDLRKFWSSLFEALLTWNKTIALFGAKLNFCLWLYDVNLEFISLLNTRRFAKIQPIASFYVHIRHHLRIFQQFPHQNLG